MYPMSDGVVFISNLVWWVLIFIYLSESTRNKLLGSDNKQPLPESRQGRIDVGWSECHDIDIGLFLRQLLQPQTLPKND